MSKLHFIKRVLYQLRKSFGLSVDYYRRRDPVIDETTGEQTITTEHYKIQKAIRLPRSKVRWPVGDVSYDASSRYLVLLASDISIVPDNDSDYLVINDKQYEILEVTELDYQQGYMLKIKAYENG